MASTETWTIGRLLEWTTSFLKARQADSPRLDAEVLLAHALGCPRIALYTRFDEEPSEEVRSQFRQLVKQRSEGAPVAYLVGRREFYSLPFRVTPDVLIPRPETELLLIQLLDLAKTYPAPSGRPLTIVDVGTGSGILAICAARWLPQAAIVAIDISPNALKVAQQNAADLGVADRIAWREANLLANEPAEPTFDFVVSNPPYVSSSEMATLARDVRDYEPHLALEAGPRGTEVIERLVAEAAERLVPGGWMLLEISPMIDTAVHEILRADGRLAAHRTINDLAGHPRVVVAQRG